MQRMRASLVCPRTRMGTDHFLRMHRKRRLRAILPHFRWVSEGLISRGVEGALFGVAEVGGRLRTERRRTQGPQTRNKSDQRT
jgi:hypothetical protein